jgi:hypothetical protein
MPDVHAEKIRNLCSDALEAESKVELDWIVRKLRLAIADYLRWYKQVDGDSNKKASGFD